MTLHALARAPVLIALLLPGALGHAASATLDAEAVERVVAADRQPGKSHAERQAAIRLAFNELQANYQDLAGDLPGAAPDKLGKTVLRPSSVRARINR